ncbi:hypothetical protein TVAG_131880 [Trichomonas vaginalis G3]|uniref:Uncharacterized protein n=1 Tax=Trichomonas vaginalis (strain ATCC PRA-98 / G3) TaxID=412133 RepID=A2FMG7_TRIV3|nr:hypothetical protein TVAGG3_0395710 [Trichomonas vaginalis G3]EAX93900.1 hypothetical protein TVAG_131880 [Trichomonas vaginalis G3]KAI5534325.1 hypothetical protein TVAGG3_0395710 [Trichomonas vaginalis G3]|eukprot:XP_001306830.1 hypothetical protein [Trichomonas vaginalis G3]
MIADYVDTHIFENQEDIISAMIESLCESINENKFYERLEKQEDRDFIIPFLLIAPDFPNQCIDFFTVITKLFITTPNVHKLQKIEYNNLLQKTLTSIQPLLCSKADPKNRSESLHFIKQIISKPEIEYLDFIEEDTWIILLSTIISSLDDFISMSSDQKFELVVSCILLGRISEKRAQKVISNFIQIFIKFPLQEYYIMNYYNQVITRFFTYPTKDSSKYDIQSHKYSIFLIAEMNRVCREEDKSKCFPILLSIENKFNINDHPFLISLFPISSIIRIFADCIFTNISVATFIICHLNMLTHSDLAHDSPWNNLFVQYISSYIQHKEISTDEMLALSSLAATNPLFVRQFYTTIIKSYKNASQAFLHYQTTLLANISQICSSIPDIESGDDACKYMTFIDYSKIEKAEYRISFFFDQVSVKNLDLLSYIIQPDFAYFENKCIGSLLLLIALVPSFTRDNSFGVEKILFGILKLLENTECEEILSQIAIAAISLRNFTNLFQMCPTIVSMLYRLADKYKSKLLHWAAKACCGIICSPDFAEKVSHNGTPRTFVMNNKILMFIESENESNPLELLVRKTTGIFYYQIKDEQISQEVNPAKVKKDIISYEDIIKDVEGPFEHAEKREYRKPKNRTTKFFLSMGILPVPTESSFDTSKFDSFCKLPEFYVKLICINMNSTDYSGKNPGLRYERFTEDLGESVTSQLCKINFNEKVNSPFVIIFNETKMRFNKNIDDIKASIVLYISMNDSLKDDQELTYHIKPLRLPRSNIIFPFSEESDHVCCARNLQKFVFSFVFFFLGSKLTEDTSLPELLVPFINSCEERHKIVTNAK